MRSSVRDWSLHATVGRMDSLEGTTGREGLGAPAAGTVNTVPPEAGGALLGRIVAEKFRIERVLGEGGMGIVYLAVHCDLEQPVAIKVIREELAQRESLVERMMQEARTAAKFRSEHIGRVLDVGRLPTGAPYLVLEYLEGEDLASHLDERGTLPCDQAVSLALQCCEALAEAHAAGIVHRDIKPDNLFLTTRSDGATILKVLDFGISKSSAPAAESIQPEMVIGSPQYMAPEQMRATEPVDERADIWSLGVVLYEMLTGRLPFEALTVAATCSRVMHEPHESVSSHRADIPVGVQSVLERCFRKQPRERFATVADLACALAPYGQVGAEDVAERVVRVLAGFGNQKSKPISTRERRVTPVTDLTPAAAALLPARLSRPPGRRTWLAALGAGVALGLGALLLLTGKYGDVSSSQASQARTIGDQPEVGMSATVAQAAVEVSPVASSLTASSSPPAADSPTAVTARAAVSHDANRPTARAGKQAKGPPPSPARPTPTATTSASAELPPPDPGPDAWDPSTFGGRK